MSRRPRSPAADGASAPKRRNTGPFSEQDEAARVCRNFINHLFGCPDLPPKSPPTILPLMQFITHVLRHAGLPASVTFATLFLLERVKTRFPTIGMASGHRIFMTAFIIAAKVLVDPPHRPSWWDLIVYKTFEREELDQMEREMLACLGWDVQVQPEALVEFEEKVRGQFRRVGPYPTPYVLPADVHTPTPFSTPPGPAAEEGVDASSASPSHARGSTPTELFDLDPAPVHPGSPSEPPVPFPSAPPTPELWNSMSGTPASAEFPATPAGYVGSSSSVPVVLTGKGTATGKTGTINSQALVSTSHMPGTSH